MTSPSFSILLRISYVILEVSQSVVPEAKHTLPSTATPELTAPHVGKKGFLTTTQQTTPSCFSLLQVHVQLNHYIKYILIF